MNLDSIEILFSELVLKYEVQISVDGNECTTNNSKALLIVGGCVSGVLACGAAVGLKRKGKKK